MIVAKECTKCREIKILDEYTKARKGKNGLNSRCKACDRDYRLANRERDNMAKAEWARQNPERVKASRDARIDAIRKEQAGYRKANRAELNRKQAEYITDNPHVRWEYRYRRRVQQYGLEPRIESFTREELVTAYGDACVDCGGGWDTLEHVVPVAAGGAHSIGNCRPLCFPCNRVRWAKYQSAAIAAYARQDQPQ